VRGSAVEDTLHPDRIVYGTSEVFAREALRSVYAPLVEEDGTRSSRPMCRPRS
jgi:UDPglucose 6-dehydrogenase